MPGRPRDQGGDTLLVDTRLAGGTVIPADLMGKMRASVLFLGALLARSARASMTMPGGCPLGRRPIDLHLDALARMGASVVLWEGEICCEAPALHGATIELQFQAWGATENVLLASMGLQRHGGAPRTRPGSRKSRIWRIFSRPWAGKSRGIGTDTLTIRGGAPLSGATYTVMPDRIEAATFLCACAGCGGEICLHGADGRHLTPVLDVLTGAGCELCWSRKCITLRAQGRRKAVSAIETAPYPGFPTDVQAPMMAALLRMEGSCRFSETIFERRFAHVPQLRRFGAEIETEGSAALVRGVASLRPATVTGTDLRGRCGAGDCRPPGAGSQHDLWDKTPAAGV